MKREETILYFIHTTLKIAMPCSEGNGMVVKQHILSRVGEDPSWMTPFSLNPIKIYEISQVIHG